MSYSLNEINTMAKRAARGAGYSWGIAEEAGQATRWLCSHGFNGCRILAGSLNCDDLVRFNEAKEVSPGEWRAKDGYVCPVLLGSGLVDRAYILFNGGFATVRNVIHAEMLFPFAAWTARLLRSSVSLEWDGLKFVSDGERTEITAQSEALGLSHVDEIRIWPGGVPRQPLETLSRARTDPEAWAILSDFAARSYAPATEQSRLLGAGAGLADND